MWCGSTTSPAERDCRCSHGGDVRGDESTDSKDDALHGVVPMSGLPASPNSQDESTRGCFCSRPLEVQSTRRIAGRSRVVWSVSRSRILYRGRAGRSDPEQDARHAGRG